MNKSQLEVIHWWKAGKNYITGLALLNSYGKNRTLLQSLMKRQPKYGQPKLEYELCKSVGLNYLTIDEIEVDESELASDADDAKPLIPHEFLRPDSQMMNANIDGVPGIIAAIIKKRSETYNKRGMLHKDLHNLVGNSIQAVNQRKILLGNILSLSTYLDYLYKFYQDYQDNKTIPNHDQVTFISFDEEQDISGNKDFPGSKMDKKETPDELPETVGDLKKIKKNLQIANSRDRNQLEYQNTKKQEKANPMPKSPKRDKIESRIKNRNKTIELIKYKLEELSTDNAD